MVSSTGEKIPNRNNDNNVEFYGRNSDKSGKIIYNVKTYPETVEKKMKLYVHFKKYFDKSVKKEPKMELEKIDGDFLKHKIQFTIPCNKRDLKPPSLQFSDMKMDPKTEKAESIFVKQFYKTKHAIIFKMSNNVL